MSIHSFIHKLSWSDLPGAVQHQAVRCLLDTLSTAVAGRQTDCSRIIYDFAAAAYGGNEVQLWLDGRAVSPPGAALAHAMTIDSLDIHDGYNLVKGHIGAAVIPAVLAMVGASTGSAAGALTGSAAGASTGSATGASSSSAAGASSSSATGASTSSATGASTSSANKVSPVTELVEVSGRELLISLVVGYEIAGRAGRALHGTACDYHTSGAWNALGAAAVTARRLKLTSKQTRHALGIAEYHGPRSQMMRCIDYPTMVKDGSGWGAMAGVSAAMLAQGGFTGAPAITIEGDDVAEIWADLGEQWLILDQYVKPYAVCRWAQAAIVGALALREQYHLAPEAIRSIRVHTFHEAVRLACRRPQNTEEAQYSLPFPVAAALVHGRLGASELSGEALNNPLVLRLSDDIELVEDETYNDRFPAERFARVIIETADGAVYESGPVQPTWGADDPPTDEQLRAKFRWLVGEMLPEARAAELEMTIWNCADLADTAVLNRLLSAKA